MHNNAEMTAKYTEQVLQAMRAEMAKIPKEHHFNVVAGLYMTIGKRYHKVKK